jgi:hypothetical protein
MNCREEGRKGLRADSVHSGAKRWSLRRAGWSFSYSWRSIARVASAWVYDLEWEAGGADHISAIDGGRRDPAVPDWPPTDNGRGPEFRR